MKLPPGLSSLIISAISLVPVGPDILEYALGDDDIELLILKADRRLEKFHFDQVRRWLAPGQARMELAGQLLWSLHKGGTDSLTSATPGISRQLTDGMPGHDNGDLADDGERPAGYLAAELSLGLVRLPLLGAAIRRRVRFWCATAVVGLALGGALYTVHPPAYKASTSVLLTQNPDQNPMDAVLTDVALARSRAVAGPVLRRLRIPQDVNKFLGSYTVVAVTDRVLQITVNAPSSAQAAQQAAALAAEFLSLRADELVSQQRLTMILLSQKVAAAKQRVAAVGSQMKTVSALPKSPARTSELSRLQAQSQQVSEDLIQLQQAVLAFQVRSQVSAASMIAGSGVLDPATPLARSWLRTPAAYAAAGLIAGCLLGICFVITQTLVTDRLRRRDDVALALGAPVGLSVGHIRAGWRRVDRQLGRRPGWRLPGWRALAQRWLTRLGSRDLSRVIAYLRSAVPQGPADRALVVIPVGNTGVAVLSVLSLALSCAREGKQVMVADLSEGALAARLLRVAGPGVRVVTLHDVRLIVAVPDPDSITRAGPLRQHGQVGVGPADQPLSDAYASTDLLLTIATLDPALGADYLATWASSAVVMVTAGESSVTKVTVVGDMIRRSGTTMSAVLLGADQGDESFGAAHAHDGARADGAADAAAGDADWIDRAPPIVAQADGTSSEAASVM
jgi:capsular polysaccharide biosynthesis protein